MLGIDYESSDEEEAVATTKAEPTPLATIAPAPKPTPTPVQDASVPSEPINGPAQGPTTSPLPAENGPADGLLLGSPYTSTRLTIQNLTLPTVPNWNIPPSPPGSPPQRSSKKFSQFLDLKKKGQHFNQRLENSPVLRDPSHLRKLMDFAGISEEDQYASTLPEGLGVPVNWPDWAYGDELNASQKKIAKARAKVPRDSIEFVSARSAMSGDTGAPSAKGPRQSAANRVMAGLDKEQPSRSSSQSIGKGNELEHRGGKESSKSRWRSRSRSPKRRRSRSRERR